MATVIAIANAKGGVSKTTTSLAIADNLIRKKKKVLFIDTDPQRNASGVYGAKITDEATLYDLLIHPEDTTVEECIQKTSLGDIISADEALLNADAEIPMNDIHRFRRLKKAIAPIKDNYDYIIIDTAPAKNVLLANTLLASDYIIIPVTCDAFSSQGLMDLYKVIQSYQQEDNPNLKILGMLKTRFKKRQSFTQDMSDLLDNLASQMNTVVFKTSIRESVRCQEAQALKLSLYAHAPNCTTALDYDEFVKKEIIRKGI